MFNFCYKIIFNTEIHTAIDWSSKHVNDIIFNFYIYKYMVFVYTETEH